MKLAMKGIEMNMTQKFSGLAVLALVTALGWLVATPAAVRAGDYCHNCKPSYSPDHCNTCQHSYCPPSHHESYQPAYCPPSYHYEYCDYQVKVPYTCYDECGHEYTAYKYKTLQKRVKVSD